jgi:hypothetical protein
MPVKEEEDVQMIQTYENRSERSRMKGPLLDSLGSK